MTEAEKKRRLLAVESVIGTHRAEGIALAPETLALFDRYTKGEFSNEEIIEAMLHSAEQAVGRTVLAA